MTPDRWQQIDKLFQVVVELAPIERGTFLDSSCAGDEELRREVESLITSDEYGVSFIDAPAFGAAATLLTDTQPVLCDGQQFGQYKIVRLIGRGGMGEVYLAFDEKLKRNIALKLLPTDYTSDKDRLRRFQQEAQAASALNHPNILTIYELGNVDGQQFIATEFVEGETLRERMKNSHVSLDSAIEITIQVTSALAAAHRAGIIHRDIKPENIMLRPDGYVKVLDFGLVKLIYEQDQTLQETSAPDLSVSSGLVMGTIKYMSPEQARGEAIDQRSDIFSLGAVFYEMISGRAANDGQNHRDRNNDIRNGKRTPMADGVAQVPRGVQRLLNRSLSQDAATRYQNADELLADLKTIRSSKRSIFSSTVDQIKKHTLAASVILVLLVSVALGVAYSVKKLTGKSEAPFAFVKMTRLTTFGRASMPVISPDGKYVFYGKEQNDQVSLWLKEIGTNNERELVPATQGEFGGASFSPDGSQIYYSISLDSRRYKEFAVHRIALKGGPSDRLPITAFAAVAVSPDGRLAYIRNDDNRNELALLTANSDGTNEQVVLKRVPPDGLYASVIPSWSPDGSSIAFVDHTQGRNQIAELNLVTNTRTQISSHSWKGFGGLVWLPDKSGLIVVAEDESSSTKQIWHVAYPTGEVRRLTNDISGYHAISISSDKKSLITLQVENQSRIWTVPIDSDDNLNIDFSAARQLSVDRFEGRGGLSVAPNGKIVYASGDTGHYTIWIMDGDGANRRQLSWATDMSFPSPRVSPDGKYIVFQSLLSGDSFSHIWRMDLDGGNARPLTGGQSEQDSPSFSSDGKWVIYVDWRSKQPNIWKVSIDGGEPIQITNQQAHSPVFSPDGKMIAYGYYDEKSLPRLALISAEGGTPIKTFSLPKSYLTLQWTWDGKALTFLLPTLQGPGNIWAQAIDGDEPQQLTKFTSDGLWYYGWPPDRKQLVFARGAEFRDVVLINDLR
ncbi:MAG TPA: protein kinase [Pyrinomonadaceae bacterium]|jgi:Serine/threonine protein kinase|nr:protein kinase [Pyrinomonadaceae bacterium]